MPSKVAGYQRVVGRLTKIEIENYRAFKGHFELAVAGGCNLLVYGENGAGKSSLFHAISDFLESPDRRVYDEKTKVNRPLKVGDNHNRFTADEAVIRLSFSAPPNVKEVRPDRVYEWSTAKNDPRVAEMRTVDKGKGCLDYRSLLRIHSLPRGQREINLFDLFLDPLLTHYRNPANTSNLTFFEEWSRINGVFEPYQRKDPRLDDWLKEFNAGFERVARDTVTLASRLLNDFDKELAVEMEFVPASYGWRPKWLVAPKILVKPSFRLQQASDYYAFLNEARLSALAVAIYFASLEKSPAPDFRLLVLDDILVGLDMANRMTVLGIAERLFREWQVIILTYHKAWFEILKARTRDGRWSHPWASVVLRTRRALGTELTIVAAESGSLLLQAREHFEAGDTKAAAVYARSAWEAAMSVHCARWKLPVTYVHSARHLTTDVFLQPITEQLGTLNRQENLEWARAVLGEISHARRFVLNPNAHNDPEIEDEIGAEVSAAIRAVEDFDTLLRTLRRDDFGPHRTESPRIGIADLLVAALDYLEKRQLVAALDALSRAFERHLDEFFRRRHEKVPYGVTLNLAFLFAWSGRKGVFDKATWKLLVAAKAYLLGTVSPQSLDDVTFQSAVGLVLHLRLLLLLSK